MKLDSGRHVLFVEGTDDLFVLANLLETQEPPIDLDRMLKTVQANVGDRSTTGAVVRGFVNEIKIQKKDRIGLVMDANGNIDQRRAEIRQALAGVVGLAVPTDLTRFQLQRAGSVAGVWLMPDNTSSGSLEAFLWPMVPSGALREWAFEATQTARRDKAAPFADEGKAVLRAWLAWQHQTGLPPGEALKRGLLDTKSGASFVAWFRALFGPEVEPGASSAKGP